MRTMLKLSIMLTSFVTLSLAVNLRAGQFERDIADKTRQAITNLCGSAIVQPGDELVIKSLTRRLKYPARDRLGQIIPGSPERTAEGPQDTGFLLRMCFREGPYNQPRAFFRSYPDFSDHGISTNVARYTAALVEFPKTNVFVVVDIWWGKSCDPGLVRKIYDVLLSQIKLALGEPWHGSPGCGLKRNDGLSDAERLRQHYLERYRLPRK